MTEVEVKITQKVSEEAILDQLVSAFEGGSNYWYLVNSVEGITDEIRANKNLATVEKWWEAIKNGGKVVIHDAEEPEDHLGDLTMESIQEGLQILAEKYPEIVSDIVEGTGDAETGDVFLQVCVMKEIVFG